MWDTLSLKKRAYPAATAPAADPQDSAVVDRVRQSLAAQGFGHLRARSYGQHILIESAVRAKPRDRDAVARLTALGDDVYGLSFRRQQGGWEPILLIDTLDEVVFDMTVAIAPEAAEAALAQAS
jgi:hypothetical protein